MRHSTSLASSAVAYSSSARGPLAAAGLRPQPLSAYLPPVSRSSSTAAAAATAAAPAAAHRAEAAIFLDRRH